MYIIAQYFNANNPYNDMRIELSHDILAKKVFEKASNEDKMLLQIERLITDSHQRYVSRELFMDRADVEYIDPFLKKVTSTEEELEFIDASKAHIAEIDRKRRLRVFRTNAIMLGLILIAIAAWIWATTRINHANERIKEANQIYAQKEKEVRALNEQLKIAIYELAATKDSANIIIENAKLEVAKAAVEADRIKEEAQWKVVQAQRRAEKEIKDAEEEARERIRKATEEADSKIKEANKKADVKINEANKKADEIKKDADKYRAEKTRLKNISETSQLSSQALRSLNSGDIDKATELALDARKKWKAATKDKDNKLQNAENYNALNEILEAIEGNKKRVYEHHGTSVRSVATHNKGWIASADEDGVIHFSKRNNSDLSKSKKSFKAISISSNFKDQDQIHTVAIANDNIVAGTLRGNILIFNADTLSKRLTAKGKRSACLNLRFAKTDPRIKVYKRFGSPIQHLEVSPNGEFIAFNTLMHNHLYVLKTKTGAVITNVTIKGIKTLTWENDETLWVGKKDGVSLLNFNGKKLSNQTPSLVPQSAIQSIAVNDTYIIFGDHKGRLWIVDRVKGEYIKDLNGSEFFKAHRSGITAIKFNKEGTKVVSSSMDGTAKIWNMEYLTDPENETIVLEGHEKWIYGATFSSNGEYIYTVSEDATLRQWYVEEGKMAEKLQQILDKKSN